MTFWWRTESLFTAPAINAHSSYTRLGRTGDAVPQKTGAGVLPVQSADCLSTVHAITSLEHNLAWSPRLEMQKVASSFPLPTRMCWWRRDFLSSRTNTQHIIVKIKSPHELLPIQTIPLPRRCGGSSAHFPVVSLETVSGDTESELWSVSKRAGAAPFFAWHLSDTIYWKTCYTPAKTIAGYQILTHFRFWISAFAVPDRVECQSFQYDKSHCLWTYSFAW